MTSPKEPEEEWSREFKECYQVSVQRLGNKVWEGNHRERMLEFHLKKLKEIKSQGAREALEIAMKEVEKERSEPYDGEFSPEDAFDIVLSILQSNLNKEKI